jgi:hypothetical protein
MHKSIQALLERLPLQFRVLYHQFLLRVVDLEALSIQADIIGFLGQFAGVLIMLSIVFIVRLVGPTLMMPPAEVPAFLRGVEWSLEQLTISTMMLVVGLIAVITWDATFPDRRDVMVLSPLPITPLTILCAKVSASFSVLGLAVLMLNFATGLVYASLLGSLNGSLWGVPRFCVAYWFTMAAASLFLYGSVLTVQGFTALLLPRRIFLRLSAILQLAAFGLFLGVYFISPTLPTLAACRAPENQWWLACSPTYWFFALFNQLNGSLPSELAWLALRAWIALGIVIVGAAASLLLCYLRTMKKTVEEPDLVPGTHGLHWAPHFGSPLQSAIVLFSFRSLTRSRQHRVAFAFFLAIVFAIALALLRGELSAAAPGSLSPDFLMSTYLMMAFAILGLRSVFSLPISLTANWVLRTTQLCPSQEYIAATRRSVLVLAVVPVWLLSALLSFSFRPFAQVAGHLAVLGLIGYILAELSLIGFYKVPFTCSFLPGKTNFQLVFWGFFVLFVTVAVPLMSQEWQALHDLFLYACMVAVLVCAASALWAVNRNRAKSAVLYFEELPDEVITTLGLISM